MLKPPPSELSASSSNHVIQRIRGWVRTAIVIYPGVRFYQWFRWVVRHPKITLGSLALVWALLSLGLTRSRVLISIPDMLDRASVEYQNIQAIEDSFPVANPLILTFESKDGSVLRSRQLCKIKTILHKIDYSRFDVRSLVSVFQLRDVDLKPDSLRLNYLASLGDVCAQDPEDQSTALKVAQSNFQGLLVNKEGSALVAEIQLASSKDPGPFGRFNPVAVTEIENLAESILDDRDGLTIHFHGSAGFKAFFLESLAKDSVLNVLVSVAVLLLMRWCFGTWLAGGLLVGTLCVTTGLVFAAMSVAGAPFDILTTSLFVVIALAAAEDFIYLSEFQRQQPGSWRTAFRKAMLPSFYTSLTTFVGFMSLTGSDILPIQRLGLWAGIGIMLEWAVTMLALPAVLVLVPRWQKWTMPTRNPLSGFVARMATLAPPRILSPLLLVGLIAGIYGLCHVHANDSVESMWPKSHPFSTAMKRTQDLMGWRGGIDVVFRSDVPVAQVEKFIDEIKQKSNATQVDYADRLRSFMLTPALPRWVHGIVDRALVSSHSLDRYAAPKGGFHRAVFYLPHVQMTDMTGFRDLVRKTCGRGECVASGELIALSTFSESVIETLIESFLVSLMIVSGILALLAFANGTGNVTRLIISSMWGPIVLMGMAPLVFNGVNFVTCIFAAVLVGLAGDSGIQFIFAGRRRGIEDGIITCQGASMAVSVILSITSLAYLTSNFMQPRDLGLLFCVGYIVLMIGDLWFLKLMMTWRLPGTWRLSLSWHRFRTRAQA